MAHPGPNADTSLPGFREALGVWARIGLMSFGGPAGQIALMHRMLVDERKWIGEARFLHALNYCMLLPGPEAQQLATYIGWLLHGVRGGIVAGTLFVLPGFAVIVALSALYANFAGSEWLSALFFGLKAAVLAIVVQAVIRIGSRALGHPAKVVLAALAFTAIFAFDAPFPLIVLLAGMAGYFGVRRWGDVFSQGSHGDAGALLLDDARHQTGSGNGLMRALTVTLVCGALWIAPVLLLAVVFGAHTVFVPIAAFFSKMAVVTFGGAYAVLAYVAQQAVENYGWLDAHQMLDGLALAETTPGPLVLVLVYVGFLAGFHGAGIDPMAGGLIGASLTAWVTFVPCFLWIFLGAPYVEKLRRNKPLSGALAAITAAVVGVIMNLAIWFALHVLFTQVGEISAGPLHMAWPVWGSLDVSAFGLAVLAGLLAFAFRQGMGATLALCGLAGLALHAVGL